MQAAVAGGAAVLVAAGRVPAERGGRALLLLRVRGAVVVGRVAPVGRHAGGHHRGRSYGTRFSLERDTK